MGAPSEETAEPLQGELTPLSAFDLTNPRSLVNLLPRIAPFLEKIRTTMPRSLLLAEFELRKKLRPTETTDRLRLSLWLEYDAAIAQGRLMSINRIIFGIIAFRTWCLVYERDLRRLLWIVTPPRSYELAMRQVLDASVDKLLQIVQLPLRNKMTNEIDYRLAGSILEIVERIGPQLYPSGATQLLARSSAGSESEWEG